MIKTPPETARVMETEPSHPMGAGLGAGIGGLAGAMVGAIAAGPIGVVAGATLGGSLGGAIGRDIAQDTQPLDLDASISHYDKIEPLLRARFRDRAYAHDRRFEDFAQAYLHGVACHDRHGYQVWDAKIEADVRQGWENDAASQAMPWKEAHEAIMDGWHAAEHVGVEHA